MQLNKINYSEGKTINTGNYSSVRVDVGAEGTLAIGDSISESFDELVQIVRDRLNHEAAKVIER